MFQVARYEETLAQLTGALEKSKAQCKATHEKLLEAQQGGHDSGVQLTSIHAQHKETVEQLAERSKAAAQLKADLDRVSQQNAQMSQEV